jgi:hypothetical protein
LPALGVGLGFRSSFRAELFAARGTVDFLEITADHYLSALPEKLEELELLAGCYPLIPHGLELSIGTAEGLDAPYVARLAALVKRLSPPWWSEHLAMTRAGGVSIGHLTPLPFTRDAVEATVANLGLVAERIRTPLILENITRPFTIPGAELEEAEFLREIVERADCGLLLDVTNLFANEVNLGVDAVRMIERLPPERIVQLHVVGGRWSGARYIDSHSAPIPDEIFRLVEITLERAPVKGIIIERDEELPPLADLAREVDRLRDLGRRAGRWT